MLKFYLAGCLAMALALPAAAAPTSPGDRLADSLTAIRDSYRNPNVEERAFLYGVAEAKAIEVVNSLDLARPENLDLLEQAIQGRSKLLRNIATFRLAEVARVRDLPGSLQTLMEQSAERDVLFPSTFFTAVSRMVLMQQEMRGAGPAKRFETYAKELHFNPRFSSAVFSLERYTVPAGFPLCVEHAGMIYYRDFQREPVGDPGAYADRLLDRVAKNYAKLEAGKVAGFGGSREDNYIEELKALTQGLIDLGPVAAERILKRTDLLRKAIEPTTVDSNALGYSYLLDALSGIGDARAIPVLANLPRGTDSRAEARIQEAIRWLRSGAKYPYRYRFIDLFHEFD